MNIAILGFGREGRSLLAFLRKTPPYRTAVIRVLDKNPAYTRELKLLGVPFRVGAGYLKGLDRFDIIFRSPGVPYMLPKIQRARKKGTEISSATKLFFARVPREKLIGITGTKGKGTTASLLAHILKCAGRRVVLAGNIGEPMLDALPRLASPRLRKARRARLARADHIILELSSFQLQDLTESPHVAVVLDIFPDHLDAHRSLREYHAAKTNITRWQTQGDTAFFFADNSRSRSIAQAGNAKKIAVHPKEKGVGKNAEMASAIATHLGVPRRTIANAIKTFRGLPHRLELVRTIRMHPTRKHSNILKNVGMSFYNDSAATNPQAAAAAIRSLNGRIILLAGGRGKGLDYRPLGRAIRGAKNVERVILFGENRHELARALHKELGTRNRGLGITFTNDLRSAVKHAYEVATSLVTSSQSLVTVLLSPASASFDQFKSYVDRGEQFKKLVSHLR